MIELLFRLCFFVSLTLLATGSRHNSDDKCQKGFYANEANSGNCNACECNSQATDCNALTGQCFCETKGLNGRNCDKCDDKYIGDYKNQTCYHELETNFVFTFDLNKENDTHVKKINFVVRPPMENVDVKFKLYCSQADGRVGKVNLTVAMLQGDSWAYKKILVAAASKHIETRFSADEFQFGTSANTTFMVLLYDFRTPIKITVSFAQTPRLHQIKRHWG